jgi:hypothetical protein
MNRPVRTTNNKHKFPLFCYVKVSFCNVFKVAAHAVNAFPRVTYHVAGKLLTVFASGPCVKSFQDHNPIGNRGR